MCTSREEKYTTTDCLSQCKIPSQEPWHHVFWLTPLVTFAGSFYTVTLVIQVQQSSSTIIMYWESHNYVHTKPATNSVNTPAMPGFTCD